MITPNPYFASLTIEEPATFITIGGDYPVEAALGGYQISVQIATQDVVIIEIPAVQGPAGPGIAGPIGPRWVNQGPYSASTTYNLGDVVTYGGSSYSCLQNATLNQAPTIFPGSWALLSNKGDQGIPGAGTSGTYTHLQVFASTTWNITHNLNKFPSIVTVDTTGREVEGEVTWPNQGTVIVTFSVPLSGTAYLN